MANSASMGRSKPEDDYSGYPIYGEDETKEPYEDPFHRGGGFAQSPTSSPTGQTSTSTWSASGSAPELGKLAPFEAPEWDTRKIARKTQVKAAPGVRKLRSAVQRAMARPSENPNVKAMTLREALAGYGLGLQGVMTGAESAAQSEYGREYQMKYQGETMEYQANLQRQMAEYNAAYQSYLKGGTTTSLSQNLYGDDEEGSNTNPLRPGFNYYQNPDRHISVG